MQSLQSSVTIGVGADVTLTKTVDNPNPIVGQNVTYTITVTNLGPGDARNVVVNDPIPFGTTNSVTTSTGTYNPATANWTIPVAQRGRSATLVESTDRIATASAWSTERMVTGSDQPDPNPSNDGGSDA